MAYRKSTLRSMSPVTRKVARLIGEQASIARRLKNLIPEIRSLELDSRALVTAKQTQPEQMPESIATDGSIAIEPDDMPDILSYENTGIDKPEF